MYKLECSINVPKEKWFEDVVRLKAERYRKIIADELSKKEATMQVTYNGFTGELVKLEKTFCKPQFYDLSIYDSEKQVTHSFTSVSLEDVKFLGGAVAFDG